MKFLKRIIAFASAAALSMTVLSSCNNKAPEIYPQTIDAAYEKYRLKAMDL